MSRRILLSRQTEDAQLLASLLEEKGFKPLIIPAISVTPLGSLEPYLGAINSAEVIALPSPTAARFAHRYLLHSKATVWAQGQHTAAALPASLSAQISSGIYAEDLAEAITSAHPRAKVTILCGNLARPNLEEALTAQGHSVQKVILYENRCPSGIVFPETDLFAAIYYSPSAATRHLDANPWLRGVPAIAIGKTTAQALQSGDCSRVILAASPAIAALLDALESL